MGLLTAVMGFISAGFHYYQTVDGKGADGKGSDRVRRWLMADIAMAVVAAPPLPLPTRPPDPLSSNAPAALIRGWRGTQVLFCANFLSARQFPGAAEWLLGAGAFALLYFGTLRPGMSEEAASLFYTASHGAWHLLICAASTMYVMRATHTRLGAPTVRTLFASSPQSAASAGSQREGCCVLGRGRAGRRRRPLSAPRLPSPSVPSPPFAFATQGLRGCGADRWRGAGCLCLGAAGACSAGRAAEGGERRRGRRCSPPTR